MEGGRGAAGAGAGDGDKLDYARQRPPLIAWAKGHADCQGCCLEKRAKKAAPLPTVGTVHTRPEMCLARFSRADSGDRDFVTFQIEWSLGICTDHQ